MNFAMTCSLLEKHQQAMDLLKKAVPVYEKAPFDNKPFEFYYRAGQISVDAQNFILGEKYYLTTLKQLYQNPTLLPSVNLKLFQIYGTLRQYEKASYYLNESCKSFQNSRFIENKQFKTERVCETNEALKKILEKGYLPRKIDSLNTTNNDSIFRELVKDIPELRPILKIKEELYSKFFEKPTAALAFYHNGQYNKCLNLLQDSYSLVADKFPRSTSIFMDPSVQELSTFKQEILVVLILKASAHFQLLTKEPIHQEKRKKYLLELFEKTDSLIHIISKESPESMDASKVNESLNQFYITQYNFFTYLSNKSNEETFLEKRILSLEKKKTSILLRQMYEKEDLKAQRTDKSLFQKIQRTQTNLDSIKRAIKEKQIALRETNFGGGGTLLRAQIINLKNRYREELSTLDLLQLKMCERSPNYCLVKFGSSNVSIKDMQSQLDENTTLVSYYWLNGMFYYTAIFHDYFYFEKVDFAGDVLAEIAAITACLSKDSCNFSQFKKESAYTLYRQILPKLPDNISHIIISPDGPLNELPFEMLIDEPNDSAANFKELSFLIKRRAISYAMSPSVFYEQQSKKVSNYPNSLLYFQTINQPDSIPYPTGSEIEKRGSH